MTSSTPPMHDIEYTPHTWWSVKTRRAPFRNSRDARGYGYMATAMQVNGYASPPHPLIGGILMWARLIEITRDDTSPVGRRQGPAAFGKDIYRYVHT